MTDLLKQFGFSDTAAPALGQVAEQLDAVTRDLQLAFRSRDEDREEDIGGAIDTLEQLAYVLAEYGRRGVK